MAYPHDDPGFPATAFPLEPFDTSFALPPRPRKFQSRWRLHALLLLLTVVTTTLTGAVHYASFISASGVPDLDHLWQIPAFYLRLTHYLWQSGLLYRGLWYSATLLGILGAHEMGHYLLCRRYNVDATLPYFIPMPPVFFMTGTLGAVIRIREAFPTRKILFDIGVAGPIAGFALIVPALLYGMSLSTIVPAPTEMRGLLLLGEPLLFKWAAYAVFGTVQDGYTLNMHPMVFAAWFGMLATALNLLPFGQLDGGHITYATLGRRSTPISLATVSMAVAMTFVSISWLFMTIMMLAMLFMLGPRHPRVIYEDEPLGAGRVAVAVFALIIFILCFTPVPIQLL